MVQKIFAVNHTTKKITPIGREDWLPNGLELTETAEVVNVCAPATSSRKAVYLSTLQDFGVEELLLERSALELNYRRTLGFWSTFGG